MKSVLFIAFSYTQRREWKALYEWVFFKHCKLYLLVLERNVTMEFIIFSRGLWFSHKWMKIENAPNHSSKIYFQFSFPFLRSQGLIWKGPFDFDGKKENPNFHEHSPWPSLSNHCMLASIMKPLQNYSHPDSKLQTYLLFSPGMVLIMSVPLSLYLCGLNSWRNNNT